MFNLKYLSLASLLAVTMFTACSTDEDPIVDPIEDDYTIPTTYNFENVSYTGQLERLAMLGEMKDYMKTGVDVSTSLDVDRLLAMYANADGADFANTYAKQLKSKTLSSAQADMEVLLQQMATSSESTGEYAAGTAGTITKLDGSKTYLLNDKGVEPIQLIEKGLMGACFYYQAASVYLGAGKMDVDNVTVEPGKGTEMEHHWDEGFGYFGAPIDFPTNTDGLFYWAKYSNTTNGVLGNNATIMNAFLKGRAAISNDDLTTRDEAIAEVRASWESIVVGAAMHYLNGAIADIDDAAVVHHEISEALAFIYSLKFNEAASQTNDVIDGYLSTLATTADITAFDLTGLTLDQITSVRDQMATDYGLEAVKEEL